MRMLIRLSIVVAASIILTVFLEVFTTYKSNPVEPLFSAQKLRNLQSNIDSANPSVAPGFIEANTKFGFKLFQEILQQESGKNIFLSPSSVGIALSMIYNGASGETQQAMAQALELQGMSLQEINQANQALKVTLENADPNIQLAIANSLWAKQGITFKTKFLQANQQFYQAQVTELDFSRPDAPNVINNWVKENTSGKIEEIVEEIQPNDILFLINAIYFKGNWSEEFDKNQTTELAFYLSDGSQKQHPMMSQSSKYHYYENETFQAVSLPYGQRKLSLYVFLPQENTTLEDFQEQLNTENWQQWMSQFRKRDGSIKLPRFKFDYEIQLNNALAALGMGIVFNREADFSGMTAAEVAINEVKHKTFVEVNEEGTEAAAVAYLGGVRSTSLQMPEEPFQMVVNRPFFCAILDNQTGTVLFMGSIFEPL
ncbi:serpin family protein [Lyngbya aestuarii]|uniref:serpin family protein n=1 Tax=Lyngbya aestuarii TaxID=118322 RepID=UPI00403E09E1